MKKILAASAVALLLAGCSSTEEPAETVQQPVIPDCVFPGTDKAAPGWICDEPVPNYNLTAVGFASKSAAGIGFMKDVAASDARVKLAQTLQVRVQNMFKQYIGTTGVAETETVDKVLESVSRNVTVQNLVGSRVIRSRAAPSGDLYVLVALDENLVQQEATQALRTSMKNDSALWQQFKAEQALQELDKVVEGVVGNPG